MLIFLLVFTLLYGSLHAYGFFKARAALAFGHAIGIPLGIFMAVMVFTPVIVHYLENAGLKNTAKTIAYVGYTWMALIFLFFSSGLAIDLYHAIIRLIGLFAGSSISALYPSLRLQFFLPAILSSMAVIYGFFEASHIRTEKLIIHTSRVPAQVGTLKIAQISDVHLGLMVGEKRLKRILDMVAATDPDILVSTGDLVDGEVCQNGQLVEILKGIHPRYGKFAVTGNHEYYAGVNRAVKCMEEGGFKVLRGEAVDLNGLLYIAGVDDPTGKSLHQGNGVSEKGLLSSIAQTRNGHNSNFVLLLKHRPDVDPGSVGLFDLQLSGHTHKGQIFPFSQLTHMVYEDDAGFLKLDRGSNLYVSRGTGTWGPPIRLFAPPEITIIELVHEEEKPALDPSQIATADAN